MFASQPLTARIQLGCVSLQLEDPELTLRVYAHALREEEADLGFLDFGGTKRHPRGTKANRTRGEQKPPRVSTRDGFGLMEHETGFGPATLTLARRCWG